MSCCPSLLMTRCKAPKPTLEQCTKWLGGPGNLVIEGDSNIQLMDVKKYIHPDAVNIGRGGDTPIQCIQDFPALKAEVDSGARTVKRAYLQIGGNLWTWYPLNAFDLNLTVYQTKMKELIQLFLTVIEKPICLTVSSLPYVNPKLTLPDMMGDDYYKKFMSKGQWETLEKYLNKYRLVDIFPVCNASLRVICNQFGVKYLDIFTPERLMYKEGEGYFCGSKYWWDDVHAGPEVQAMVGQLIRRSWGM